jgi:hypothetical protein
MLEARSPISSAKVEWWGREHTGRPHQHNAPPHSALTSYPAAASATSTSSV